MHPSYPHQTVIYDDWRLRQLLCEFIQSFVLTAVYRRFSRSILKTPLCVVSNFFLLRNHRKILTRVTQRSNLFCLTFNKTLRKLCPVDYSASKLRKVSIKFRERGISHLVARYHAYLQWSLSGILSASLQPGSNIV